MAIEASGELVQVGDLLLRRTVELTDPRDPGAPTLYLRAEMIDGAPQCREIRLTCPEGADQIRSTDLKIRMAGRWVGVDELVENVVARVVRFRIEPDGSTTEITPWADDLDHASARSTLRKATRASRRKPTAQLLAEVADVYRANDDGKPTKAVAEHFGIQPRTAALWVQKARAGHSPALGPAIKGKAGEF